jgi:Holliday junction resolvasome RuvABC endonuclease subunit
MNILTLDLATQTGWACHANGIIDCGSESFHRNYGKKRTPDEHIGTVYFNFYHWLLNRVRDGKLDKIIFEEPMGNFKNAAGRNVVVGLRGVLMCVCAAYAVQIDSIPQTKLKKLATGSGGAKKDQMIASAKVAFPDHDIIDDNTADALLLLKVSKELKMWS